jgi:hypothetical protein
VNEIHPEVWLLSSDSVLLVLLQCDMGLQLPWPRKQKQWCQLWPNQAI